MGPESPDFFSEGLMNEPLSEADLQTIAQTVTEAGIRADAREGKIYFSDKGVYTTFVFSEDAQRFEVSQSHDAASDDDDPYTHQSSRSIESADDINETRADALNDALSQLRESKQTDELIED